VTKRARSRLPILGFGIGLATMPACTPTNWDKPNATQADFNRDSAQCRLLARGMNLGDFYAQGSASFVAGAALGNAIGTATNQAATYRDCMLAVGYTPQASGAASYGSESSPDAYSCGSQHPCPVPASSPTAEPTEECRVYRAVVDGRQSTEESLVELVRRCQESLASSPRREPP
jgi:hypothetical protein